MELARKALEIAPDCADAYVLLAEETAATVSEARDLYERGVAAGERALGEELFRKEAGHFWAMLETRPYMRARAGLAICLWELGEREGALDHWVDTLRLNPTDSLGVRYRLVTGLLAVGRDEVAGKLLQVYQGDRTAPWLYSRALCSFRREGNKPPVTAPSAGGAGRQSPCARVSVGRAASPAPASRRSRHRG